MKTLLLLRHAKSSWHGDLDDHERPLNERGRKAASRIGRLLKRERLVPDWIVSSTAERARETALAVALAAGGSSEPVFDAALYLAPPSAYWAALQALPLGVERPLLVGHNPGIEELASGIIGAPLRMVTAALVELALPISDWAEARSGLRGELRHAWSPRELGSDG